MARPSRPLDARTDRSLVLAAADAFACDGYEGASLNQIIEAAGWGKSSLYHYFRGKQGVHDHVVAVLRGRLAEGVDPPDLESLDAGGYWRRMSVLLDELGRAARRHPETRQLGIMYHHDGSAPANGALARLRSEVTAWVAAAVRRGAALGVVRRDIPVELAVNLTVGLLEVLDQWAVVRALHSPGGPEASQLAVGLIRDVIGSEGHPHHD